LELLKQKVEELREKKRKKNPFKIPKYNKIWSFCWSSTWRFEYHGRGVRKIILENLHIG